MTLTLSLLPLFVTGNLHCLGMCGPLVHTLSLHRFKYYYLLGRLCSYTLAGGLSGALGFLASFGGFASLSIAIGFFLIILAFNQIYPLHFKWPAPNFIRLIMRDTPLSVFSFGALTLFLPCGQTLIVFAALALSGSFWIGAINGFLFALLTSPSLVLAMKIKRWMPQSHKIAKAIAFATSFAIGLISVLRGLADLGYVKHLTLSESFHIVLF